MAPGAPAAPVPHDRRTAAAHLFVPDLDAPSLADEDAAHLLRSLRLRDGEPVTASDGRGRWRRLRLAAAPSGRQDARLEPDGPILEEPVPAPSLTLAVALPKGDRGDWAVQKLTELGVDCIVVLRSERSVVRWEAERAERGLARLERIARQAAMQARLVRLPGLAGPVSVAELLSRPAGSSGPHGVASGSPRPASGPPSGVPGLGHRADLASPAAADPGARSGPDLDHPCVLVGPEGGWAPGELPDHLPRFGLGPTILRTETAAVAAATALTLQRAGLLGPGTGRGQASPVPPG